ncbi:MAG: ABC transporter permease [Bacteroidales bacterium]|nr:ABC transporter permease [Bacteroidales bacterium]
MFIKNLIHSFRLFFRNKLFSLINIVGLSVGLAAFFYIFFWIVDEVTYDRCFEEKDRIYIVLDYEQYSNGEELYFTPNPAGLGPELKAKFPEIEETARLRGLGTSNIKIGEKIFSENQIAGCDSGFFNIFDFKVKYGNSEQLFNDKYSVVLFENIAEKFFGEENPIGKSILINNTIEYTVSAILKEPKTKTHLRLGILLPFESLAAHDIEIEGWRNFSTATYVLLNDEVALDSFNLKIKDFIKDYMEDAIATISLFPLNKIRLHSSHVLSSYSTGNITNVYILTIIAFLIIVIACINYINLNTTQQLQRLKEIGIRKVLGASKRNIRGQLLIESFIYAFLATDIAIILFEVFKNSLNQLSGKVLDIDYSLYRNVILLITTTLFIGFISSVFPVLFQSRYKVLYALKGVLKGVKVQTTLRKSLIVFQFVITFLLILGSLTLKKQLNFVASTDLGFDKENLYYTYLKRDQRSNIDLYKQELSKLNGVKEVSACYDIPGDISSSFIVEYKDKNGEDKQFLSNLTYADENYLNVAGINVIKGNNFSGIEKDSISYLILNETACKYLGIDDPINLSIRKDNERVVGVIKDYNFSSLHENVAPLFIYFSNKRGIYLLIKLGPEHPDQTLIEIKKKWDELNPDHLAEFNSIQSFLDRQYLSDSRFHSIIITFAFLTVLIACLGLYGLSQYEGKKRTKEIGIRKALGASVTNLIGLLSSDFIKLVVIAIVIALPFGYLLIKEILEPFAYKINVSWLLFFYASLISITIAFATIIYQVYTTSKTNPIDNLRYE